MSETVLVAYATVYGSTQEVAEAVAGTLRECGLQVDCLPAGDVRLLDGYDAIVLGTAIYIGRLHKEARRFLLRHEKALRERPTAIFAMGPFHNEEKEWKAARGQVQSQLGKFPWLRPVSCEVFGGTFDPAKLRFPFSFLPPVRNLPASDIRDWDAIRRWAKGLADQLQPALAHTAT